MKSFELKFELHEKIILNMANTCATDEDKGELFDKLSKLYSNNKKTIDQSICSAVVTPCRIDVVNGAKTGITIVNKIIKSLNTHRAELENVLAQGNADILSIAIQQNFNKGFIQDELHTLELQIEKYGNLKNILEKEVPNHRLRTNDGLQDFIFQIACLYQNLTQKPFTSDFYDDKPITEGACFVGEATKSLIPHLHNGGLEMYNFSSIKTACHNASHRIKTNS